MTIQQAKVVTSFWFDGSAEEAATLYTSLLPDSRITSVMRPQPDGLALAVAFLLGRVHRRCDAGR